MTSDDRENRERERSATITEPRLLSKQPEKPPLNPLRAPHRIHRVRYRCADSIASDRAQFVRAVLSVLTPKVWQARPIAMRLMSRTYFTALRTLSRGHGVMLIELAVPREPESFALNLHVMEA